MIVSLVCKVSCLILVVNKVEYWKNIKGYEGFYKISNKGRVLSVARTFLRNDGRKYTVKPKILNPSIDKDGYLRIELNKVGKSKKYHIHRLVGNAFVTNTDNKPEINHIDGIKTNNASINLEWVTSKENSVHAAKLGLLPDQYGGANPNAKLSKSDVFLIRSLRRKGKSISFIASEVGTSVSNVKNILGGHTWKWLKDGEERLV